MNKRVGMEVASFMAIGLGLAGCTAPETQLSLDEALGYKVHDIGALCTAAALESSDARIEVVQTFSQTPDGDQHRFTVSGGGAEYTWVVPSRVDPTAQAIFPTITKGPAELVYWSHTDGKGSSAEVIRDGGSTPIGLRVDAASEGTDPDLIIGGMCPPYSSK